MKNPKLIREKIIEYRRRLPREEIGKHNKNKNEKGRGYSGSKVDTYLEI